MMGNSEMRPPDEKLTAAGNLRQDVFYKKPRIINRITTLLVPALFLLVYSVRNARYLYTKTERTM